jgi:hypothetical protein
MRGRDRESRAQGSHVRAELDHVDVGLEPQVRFERRGVRAQHAAVPEQRDRRESVPEIEERLVEACFILSVCEFLANGKRTGKDIL